jgi:hypothetical protein
MNKIDKSFADMTKWRKKTQINKIRAEKADISEIQRIIREYFENIFK